MECAKDVNKGKRAKHKYVSIKEKSRRRRLQKITVEKDDNKEKEVIKYTTDDTNKEKFRQNNATACGEELSGKTDFLSSSKSEATSLWVQDRRAQ